MKFIVGKKIDMTQIWQSEDKVIAATKVKLYPCVITQIKYNEKDGYSAVQLGFGEGKEGNIKKPQKGHLKNLSNLKKFKEFRMQDEEKEKFKRGDKIDLSSFEVGDKIQIVAVSKGKGFQGVVKKYGFAGQSKTHGTKDQVRMPGSAGATGPAHVFKGTRMPGRMGGDQKTIKNLEIIKIDLENNIIFLNGPIPGARNSVVFISGEGELKLVSEKVDIEKNQTENKDLHKEKQEKEEEKKEKSLIEEKSEELKEDKEAQTKEEAVTNNEQEKK